LAWFSNFSQGGCLQENLVTLKIKKRYAIAALLCSGLFVTCRMEFMKFRKSDQEQRAFFTEKGLPPPE
jgi:hypothetical protein